MSRIKEVLGYVLGGILIFGGLLSMFWLGVPNLTYNKPTNVVSEITDYYFYHSQTSTVFYLKSESLGLYVANEPINVSVTTNRMDVRGVQLRFLGAGKYFPNNTAPPESPPSGASLEEWKEWEQAMQHWWDLWEENLNKLSADILRLTNDTDLTFTDPFTNETRPNYPTFSGSIQNLTYSVGGQFSIGITIFQSDGGVIGYDMGDTSYVLQNVIEVSPPETLLQIKSNYISVGLGWIGIGVSPLLAGILLTWETAKSRLPKYRIYAEDWD